MKYKVLKTIKHNGKYISDGVVDLEKNEVLEERGFIEPIKETSKAKEKEKADEE